MQILVIGGTRFIGPPTVLRLHAMGHKLMLFHRQPSTIEFPADIEQVLGDRRTQLAYFAEIFRKFEPDVVLDMAPIFERDAMMVMQTFKGMAWRVVAISSQDVYRAYGRINGTEPGDPDPNPITEDSPLREKWYPYRAEPPRAEDDPMHWADEYDKIPVEHAVLSDPKMPGTVLRLPMIYGPGDYQHRLFPHLKRMDDGRQVILMDSRTAHWRWTRDYVENTAAAIALAVTDDRAAGRTYNLGDMPAQTMSEWVRSIGRAAGWHGEVIIPPDDILPESMRGGPELDQNLEADSSRIRQELGFVPPVSRDDALRRTVEWERANPPAQINPAEFDYAAEDAVLAKLGR